jgi:EPS-associated MarR family transcriptional regulator
MLTDEMRYKLLKILEQNPKSSQREIARELGVSLGRVNYCLQALTRRGWVKAKNFSRSKNKAAYMYLLTPRGFEQKAAVTLRFLRAKTQEYEALSKEIDQIRKEVELGATAENHRSRGIVDSL